MGVDERAKISKYGRWNPVPQEIKNGVVDLYKTGKMAKEVAEHYGIDNSHVGRILKQEGVQLRTFPRKIILSKEQEDKIIALYKSGISINKIEKIILIGEKIIENVLIKNEVPLKRRKFLLSNHANEIIHLYQSGRTCKEIGSLFDMDTSSIWLVLKNKGIKLRSYSAKRLTTEQALLVKIKNRMRSRVNMFFRNQKRTKFKKPCSTMDLIGCSAQELKEYIESKFLSGMNWENHGMHGWHADHRVPLASAENLEELIQLFHYTNLQPLWAEENLRKSSYHNGICHAHKKKRTLC